MKKYSYLAGAAFLAVASTTSFADIILVATPVNLTTLSGDPILTAAGWVGYSLDLVASGASTQVAGIDFFGANPGGPQSNIGIIGHIKQEWVIPSGGNIGGPGISQATPTNTTIGAGAFNGYDSFLFIGAATGNNGGFLSDPNPPAEDNNLANGANPPYTQSPVLDTPAVGKGIGQDEGVGSLMTVSGAYDGNQGVATIHLAFIIVPGPTAVGGPYPTTIRGVAKDQTNTTFFPIDVTLNPGGTPVPEPASVGLLALGGLALLARRRRKA